MSNIELVKRLFENVNAHKPDEITKCYHNEATFEDIAFSLKKRRQVEAMWKYICLPDSEGKSTNIKVVVKSVDELSDGTVVAEIIDDYTFRETSQHVVNPIHSIFRFQDNLIIEQHDECNRVHWADQAYGDGKHVILNFLVDRAGWILRLGAMKKLKHAYPAAFEQ